MMRPTSPLGLSQSALFRQLVSREEKAEFESGGVLGIGAVNRVALDVGSPLLADRAFFGIRGIRGAH